MAAATAHDINTDDPKGYLNVLHFDKEYNLVDIAFVQLDEDYIQTGVTKMPHQLLSRSLTITKAGYVYVFLSNEGAVEQNIYFDDATYTHIKSPVVQSEDYYAFGMSISDKSYHQAGSMNNPYQYNGKEKQDELDLGWLDYGAQMYDAAVGRWHVVDPLMEVSRRWSPYVYCYNNPIIFVDPDGRLGTVYGQETNHATGSVDIYDFSGDSGGMQGQGSDSDTESGHESLHQSSLNNKIEQHSRQNIGDKNNGEMGNVLAKCDTCPNEKRFKRYIDDPDNNYFYDPKADDVSFLLPEVVTPPQSVTPKKKDPYMYISLVYQNDDIDVVKEYDLKVTKFYKTWSVTKVVVDYSRPKTRITATVTGEVYFTDHGKGYRFEGPVEMSEALKSYVEKLEKTREALANKPKGKLNAVSSVTR